MTGFTAAHLREAAHRIAVKAAAAAPELNAQDGQLGDGDLGITLASGWAEIVKELDRMPEDVGQVFLAWAKAFQRASSSSFGTLVATALMSAAKACKGRDEIPWSEVSALIAGAREAMMARGKGALGDKSVLDIADAVAAATQGLGDPAAILSAADAAASACLDRFRDLPSRLGRARMFAEKSQGLDDPGMLAFRRGLDGLIA